MLVQVIEILAIRFECNWFDRAWRTVEIGAEKAVGSLTISFFGGPELLVLLLGGWGNGIHWTEMTALVASMTSFSKLRNMVAGGREAVHSKLHLSGWVGFTLAHCPHHPPKVLHAHISSPGMHCTDLKLCSVAAIKSTPARQLEYTRVL